MEFDTVLGATKTASQNLYTALVPFVAIAALGLLMYEAYKVFQGNAATLGATLLRIGVAVVLLGNFQTWMDTATGAVQGLVQQVGGGTTSEDLMQSYSAVLKDPGAKETSGGQRIKSGPAGRRKNAADTHTAGRLAGMKAF